MITVPVLDDQDLPVAAKRPGEFDAPIEGRDDPAAGGGQDDESLADLERPERMAQIEENWRVTQERLAMRRYALGRDNGCKISWPA